MADNTTELEVLDEIVDVLGGQSGQYETVVPTLQQILALLGGGGGGGGYNPSLSVGRADALTGADTTAQWAQRVTTGSGAATVRSVQGAAVGWNQLFNVAPNSSTSNGVTFTVENGSIVANGTATGLAFRNTAGQLTADHKYLYKGCPSGGSLSTYYAYVSGPDSGFVQRDTGNGVFFTALSSGATNMIVAIVAGNTATNLKFTMQLFDLTAMFGSGNEPATVAEFERMYPASYYTYSVLTLKPVTIEGIRSTNAQGGELDAIEWTAQTLRAAGSVRDELTSDKLVTRVGVVDLGTLDWSYYGEGGYFRTVPYGWLRKYDQTSADIQVAGYPSVTRVTGLDKGAAISDFRRFIIKDTSFGGDVDAFKAAMSGVLCFYPVAEPTTTPISPALDMTYRVEQGGMEAIIVPTGEVSAAPVLTVAEGESAADVVMDALACIAAPDGPVATASHAVNTYLTMQGKLYKVTSAIAVGETIKSGTNVTETTVMAELIARTA